MDNKIEPSIFLRHGVKRRIDIRLVRHITRHDERIFERPRKLLDVLLKPFALIRKRHLRPMCCRRLSTRPSDRTLVRDAEYDSDFVFEHWFLVLGFWSAVSDSFKDQKPKAKNRLIRLRTLSATSQNPAA